MPAKFKISVHRPCSAVWDTMPTSDGGRHCDSCQQSVIDFTRFSDQDLQSWFIKNQEKSCGRFNPEQLDRLIAVKSTFRMGRFKPGIVATALIAFLTVSKSKNAQAAKPAINQTNQFKANYRKTDQIVADSLKVIKGKVFDKDDRSPLPGAILSINNGLALGVTDRNGLFEIKLPKDFNDKKINLTAKYIGYKTLNSSLNLQEKSPFNIELCASNEVLGGPEVIYIRKPSVWNRLKRVFKNKN